LNLAKLRDGFSGERFQPYQTRKLATGSVPEEFLWQCESSAVDNNLLQELLV
jgi:hypothetical protein